MDELMLIGIAAGSAAFCVILVIVVYALYRRKTRDKEKKYVQIGPTLPERRMEVHYVQNSANTNPSLNLRAIPFTVPGGMRSATVSPSNSLEFDPLSDNSSNGGTSGPTGFASGPTGLTAEGIYSRRISIDSVGSLDVRGAYSLGQIDPSLYTNVNAEDDYETPEDHIGRLWFAVEYEREAERLLVTVMKARKLPSRSFGNSNGCDPFVRIHLMPDDRRYLQTKPKKKCCNPNFEERFVFQVSNKSLKERALRFTVFDVDRYRKHQVIGHAIYPLKDHDYDCNERVVIWRDLERIVADTVSEKGELLLSLCYNSQHQRLTVGVFEGKNFWKPEQSPPPAYYLKVSILMQSKVVKSKRTDIIKKTCDPCFNESFSFKLSPNNLDSASISIVAMQYSIGHRDKQVGRISLGSFMFSRGKELNHWNEMVANQKQQISNWHRLT